MSSLCVTSNRTLAGATDGKQKTVPVPCLMKRQQYFDACRDAQRRDADRIRAEEEALGRWERQDRRTRGPQPIRRAPNYYHARALAEGVIYCIPLVYDEAPWYDERLCYYCTNKLERPASPVEKSRRDPKPDPDPRRERQRERGGNNDRRRGQIR